MPQRLSDVPLTQLVPETQEWNGGAGIDLLSWIGCVSRIEHAIGYGELFWPDFVEFDGCILRAGFEEQNYLGFMKLTGGNKQSVEAVLNHLHIVHVFAQQTSEPTREQVVYLGRLLKDMWAAKLQRDFPGRRIVVSFPEEGCEDLLDYEISIYQDREPPTGPSSN